MSGLVWKDMLIMRKTIKAYCVILVFYLIMAAMGLFTLSFVTGIIEFIVMMVPYAAFTYDEQAKWERYACALPMGRRAVVTARYVFTLLLLALAAAVGLGSSALLAATGQEGALEGLAATLGCLGMGVLAADVILPLSYKLGVERARPFLYVVVFLPVLLIVGGAQLGLLDGLNSLSDTAMLAIFVALALVPVAGLLVSYLVSCRIMERKEF